MKRFTPEQIVAKLRQADRELQTVEPHGCCHAEVVLQVEALGESLHALGEPDGAAVRVRNRQGADNLLPGPIREVADLSRGARLRRVLPVGAMSVQLDRGQLRAVSADLDHARGVQLRGKRLLRG